MKNRLYFILSIFLVGLIVSSCQEDTIISEFPYEAEVIGENADCGLYTIKITQGAEKVKSIIGTTAQEDTYIAKNLPKNLEIDGLKLRLDIRKPESNKLGACTLLGPSYTWVFVIKAEKK